MSVTTTTAITGTDSLSATEAISIVLQRAPNPLRLDDLRAYLREMHALCQRFRLVYRVLVAQAYHETGAFGPAGRWNALNPAGLGITQDSDPTPYRISSGEDAAQIHVWSMLVALRRWDDAASCGVPVGAESWQDRWTAKYRDPVCPNVRVIDDLNRIYADNRATWAVDTAYDRKLVDVANSLFPGFESQEEPNMALNMTKGLIKLPPMEQSIVDVNKRIQSNQCRGFDWLGARPHPKGLILHRAQSEGTIEGYFHQPCCPALTDLEIHHQTGKMKRYVRIPGDSPSGWANGTYNGAYGDGLAFGNRYGVTAVNRDVESCEFTGWFHQPGTNSSEWPVADVVWPVAAQWMASRAHDYGITWETWPLIPSEGNRSYLIWHQEFTLGTGKVCPGKTVMDNTARMVEIARGIMRAAQTGGTEEPIPAPPKYAPLNVPAFLTARWLAGGEDAKLGKTKVWSLRRRWNAAKETPRLQHTGANAPEVGPPLKKGESFVGIGIYRSHNVWWILTEWGTRVAMEDMTDQMMPGYPDKIAA